MRRPEYLNIARHDDGPPLHSMSSSSRHSMKCGGCPELASLATGATEEVSRNTRRNQQSCGAGHAFVRGSILRSIF
jgi:hypothetical protein